MAETEQTPETTGEAAATPEATEAAGDATPEAAPSQPSAETRRERLKQRRAYRAKLKERRAAAPRETREPLTAPEESSGRPKVRQGVVSSAKGDKTITVQIDVVRRHRRYHKIMRSTQKVYAHDEANTANEGDTVRVVECRPMSRSKRWRLSDVVERAR